MRRIKSMAIAAIIIAIAFVFLYMAAILPSGRIACLCISTACICVIVIEGGIKIGISASVVLSILGYLFVPDKLIAILFIMFFSYYPVLKLLIEQKNNMLAEWVIKGIFFLIISSLGIVIMNIANVLPIEIKTRTMFALGVIVLVLVEMIFDYALSLLIGFYMKRIMPVINKNYR